MSAYIRPFAEMLAHEKAGHITPDGPRRRTQYPSEHRSEGERGPRRVRFPFQGHQEGNGQLTRSSEVNQPDKSKRYRAFLMEF